MRVKQSIYFASPAEGRFETFHPENGAAACPLAAEIPIDAVGTLLRLERSGSIFTHLCHLRFPAERARWAVSP